MRHCIFLFAALLWCAVGAAGQTVSLDQHWELLPDPDAKYTLQTLPKDGWRPVRVGISWNAQFDDMRDFGGVGWYKTSFNLPDLGDSHFFLQFAACDYFCEVFLNNNKIGRHEGGYTPFKTDVRLAGKPGKNDLLVRVSDPMRDENRNKQIFPQFMYAEIPHGKQNWYVQTGGLWQPVGLGSTPPIDITGMRVTATMDGKVTIDIAMRRDVFGKTKRQADPEVSSAHIVITAPDGRIEFESKFAAIYGDYIFGSGHSAGTSHVSFSLGNPRPWSPDTPNLYTAKAEVVLSNGATESQTVRFGFRELTTRDGKLYLNGKPFYLIGALDQDFYPATIYTPPSPEYIRDEMRTAKALGLNTLRCHIKTCTPDYLDAADEVGMLIWYEIPSWNDERHWTQQAADRGMQVFREALERDWNHPSLGIQSIINESWGADLSKPEQRKWLASAYDEAKKAVAPLGRLVDDNSACCDNFHVKSDLADFHQYYSIPDHAEQWSKWVQDFASRPKWVWSPYGDAQSTGNEPLIVSEFGNWGLPRLPCGEAQSKPSECSLPWWFSRDFNGREITMPAGVLERFHQFKLDRIFSSYNELAEATQWHQFESLKYEIEQIRAQPNVQGYVITEFTDVNWESNGLMDIWRNPKVYEKELAQIQQPDFVAGSGTGTAAYAGWLGATADLPWAHFKTADPDPQTGTNQGAAWARGYPYGKIEVYVDDGGYTTCPLGFDRAVNDRPQPPTGPNTVRISSCGFATLKDVEQPTMRRETTILRDADGRVLAQNRGNTKVFPKHTVPDVPVALATGLPYEFRVLHTSADAAVSISQKWDQAIEQKLSNGGTVILLADSADALPPNFPVQLKAREGSNYNGDWISNFNWILPSSPVFRDIAFNKIMGFEAQRVRPDYVLLGLKPEQFEDVLSGAFYGWIHNNSALVLQARYGKGKLLITTFRFDKYGSDPYATYLLDNMIRYVSSTQFAPKLDFTAH